MKLISNLDEAFNGIADLTKALHFETDEKRAEEMKIELGRRQGEVTRTKQIEGGEYALRRFRKEIKFGDGTYLGVFLPGSYDAATSKLGDGPHKKAVKKIKWNQKKYDQWLEDVASNDGWKNAYDMAQNAKHEPGLLDWAKKAFRGEDVMQRIQWDIEAFAESVVTESFVAYTENSKGEYEVVKVLKDQRAAKAWRKKNAYLLDDESVDVKSIGTTPKKDWDKTHPELAIESAVNEEKIKYAKGKTYQSSGHWTVYVDSNSSGFDIRVNHSAGWRLDPHDEKEETLELLDNGRQRATIYFKSGNIDKFAQQMFDLNDRTTNGNQTKLTAKDYADIIRVWIDMKMANESSNGSVSLNPGMTTGGIGDPVLPTATTVGSGDMLAVADIDDDEEEAKKDKTKTKLEMEGFQLHTKFTNFIAESVVNEALSKEQKMVETFLNKIAKEYDYSIQDAVRFVKETISKMGLDESIVNEAVSRDTKIYQIATPAPQSMLLEELEELFGDDYRNIVTEFKEDEGYESVLMFNLSKSDIKKIEDNIADVLIWEYSIKKGKTITESIVTEAKFVKEFDEAVLKATTQEEVLEIYPNAEFFIGKSDHFFGEFDENLFFKAYYTKGQKEFEIKSIYSEKNSNYVHLYNESVVTEAKAYKLKASEFGGDTHSAAYNVKGETTWRVHSTYAIDQVSGENNPEERDVVFFEAMPINNDIYIKIGGINNLKRTNGSTVGDNFGTTIEEWKKDPSGIAKEASDFLTDATHLKWINKKARSEGQVIKWALKDDYSSVIEDLVNKSLGLSEGIYAKQSKIQPGDYIQTQYGYFYKRVEGQVGGQDAYVEIKKGKEGKKKTSIHDTVDFDIVDKSIALDESQVTEKREDVGKYNTVKKVIAKIGRRPSEQELATFITKNYYDVTEVERGDDDPAANDKIADLVAFYKYDIDDWNIAWVDAQNESAKTFKYIKPLNEYYGKREHDDFEKEFGKIKYPKWIKVKMKELVDGQFIDKLYAKPYNYMSLWLNQMGKRKFNTDDRKKELGEVGYKLTDRYWHDLTGHTAFKLEAAEAAMEVSKHIQDMVANKEEVEPSYYLMKNYFNTFGMQTDRSRIFNMAVEILDEWMTANAIETL